jgi:hypothetical protein
MPHDACYTSVMKTYGKWSARAAQAVAKCRKKHGHVHKGKAGSSLRQWERERWVDKITGKPCGAGGSTQYCRPTKRVNAHTPKMPRGSALKRAIATKRSTGHAPTFRKK